MAKNGIEWPSVCYPTSESRFLTVGDWGGACGWGKDNKCTPGVIPPICAGGPGAGDPGKPCPMPNRHGGVYIPQIEARAQRLVSDRMLARATQLQEQGTPAQFVINVGDNFYPGGIDEHCGNPDMAANSTQFAQVWKAMYPGVLTEMEWWSVLGNHDYGGVCYIKGWDQQIYYTYHQDKWVMPGQFWRRRVQYSNFNVDFFFIDGNVYDANPSVDEEHNICSRTHNPGVHCELAFYPSKTGGDGATCAATGPAAPWDTCFAWFKSLWEKQYNWLHEVVPKSDADWQIIVSHYPASYNMGYAPTSFITWSQWLTPMGIDLFIAGHTHEQRVYYGDWGIGHDMQDTAWVITGGGGGVTSEILPTVDGNDDAYGFMEIAMSLEELKITAYSHGGVDGKTIVRNQTTVKPVPRKSHVELLQAGLLTEIPTSQPWEADQVDLVV